MNRLGSERKPRNANGIDALNARGIKRGSISLYFSLLTRIFARDGFARDWDHRQKISPLVSIRGRNTLAVVFEYLREQVVYFLTARAICRPSPLTICRRFL